MPSARMSRILARIDRIAHATDFDRDDLGEDLLDIVRVVMERDFDRGVAPDGSDWPELSERYFAFKERHALTTQMGYLWGTMATEANFIGDRKVKSDLAESEFGTDPVSKQECALFSERRPFVGFSAEAKDLARAKLNKRIGKACGN
jgi:hypothetical protein